MSQHTPAQQARHEQAFTRAQQAWRDAYGVALTERVRLDGKYQSYQYAKVGERKRLDALRVREDKACERCYRALATIAVRDWTQGVPCSFVRDELTVSDATTRGQLAIVPPPAYGYHAEDMRRFAWPLPERTSAPVDISTIHEYGLSQKLSNSVRCF